MTEQVGNVITRFAFPMLVLGWYLKSDAQTVFILDGDGSNDAIQTGRLKGHAAFDNGCLLWIDFGLPCARVGSKGLYIHGSVECIGVCIGIGIGTTLLLFMFIIHAR